MKSNLLDEARRLPLSERIELVEAIWDTVAQEAAGGASSDALPIPYEHRQELDRRLEDPAAAAEPTLAWEDVRLRLARGQ